MAKKQKDLSYRHNAKHFICTSLLVYKSSIEKTFKTGSTLAAFHHRGLQLPPHMHGIS